MKKFIHMLFATCLCIGFAACSNDDEPETELKVSPSSISLLSDEGKSTSFSITYDSDWSITYDADWIHISANSGVGNATITVTTLSANNSASARSTELIVSSDDQTAIVTVSQEGGAVKNCTARVKGDVLTLANSMAFELEFDSNVSYFYAGYISVANSAGWTDEKYIDEVAVGDASSPEEGIIYSVGDLSANTDYYLITIAYNAAGKRGEVVKERVTTKAIPTNYPWISVTNVSYNSSEYAITTQMNGVTSKYYVLATSYYSGVYAYYTSADALSAYLIKENIVAGDATTWAQSTTLYLDRVDDYVFVATWGVDANNEFSPKLYKNVWSIGSRSISDIKKDYPVPGKILATPISDISDYEVYSFNVDE